VCDDPDRGSELISLVGYMTLAALQELERREVLAGNSIPNMGYILSLLISVGWVRGEIAGDDFMDHVSWVYRVMAMAEAAGITIGGASGYVHTAEEVGEREAEGTTAELVKKWEKVIFANKVSLQCYKWMLDCSLTTCRRSDRTRPSTAGDSAPGPQLKSEVTTTTSPR